MSYKDTWQELDRAQLYLDSLHDRKGVLLDQIDDVREEIRLQEHEVECWADRLAGQPLGKED